MICEKANKYLKKGKINEFKFTIKKKAQINSKKKNTNSYYPINSDPLGMTIKLYKPILQYILPSYDA